MKLRPFAVATAVFAFASSQCLAQSSAPAGQESPGDLPQIRVTAPKAKPKKKKTVAARRAPAAPTPVPADVGEAPRTVVERNAPPSTGTLGQPPAPYAGGQVATGAQVGVLGNRSVFDTPLSIKSYTAEGIQNRQATSVSQILDTDPSVVAIGRGNAFEYFTIRGFTLQSTFVGKFDGLNIPHVQPAIPELYERIEVIKGPSALLYPQLGGIAGTINYVPKFARDKDITEITTSVSSDSQVRGHLDVGRRYGPNGEWGVRANVVGNTGDTYRRDGSNDLAAGSLALDFRSDQARFAVYGDMADTTINNMQGFSADFTGIGMLLVPNPRTVGSFPNGPFYEARSSRVYATGEVDLTETLTAYAKFGGTQTDGTNDSFNSCPFGPDGACTLGPFSYGEYRYYLASEFGVRAQFDTGLIRHRVTVAGSTQTEMFTSSGDGFQTFDSFNTNFFDPQNAYNRVPVFQTKDYFGRTELRSAVLADTLSVFNDAIQLTLGVRQQEITTSGAFAGFPEPAFDDTATTPMYGLVVKPMRGLSLYASYIEALEKGGSGFFGGFPVTLAPAISKQTEVGAKWDLGSVAVTLALFDIERPNDITFNGEFGRFGSQNNRGVELEVFGEPVKGLRVIGGVTFLDAKVSSPDPLLDGKAPPGAPDFVTKFGAELDIPNVGLTLTGLVIHTDQQFVNAINTTFIDDWTRFDLGFRYAVTDSIVVRGLVENVADSRYWESADRGFFLNIGAPRTYSLSSTFKF